MYFFGLLNNQALIVMECLPRALRKLVVAQCEVSPSHGQVNEETVRFSPSGSMPLVGVSISVASPINERQSLGCDSRRLIDDDGHRLIN